MCLCCCVFIRFIVFILHILKADIGENNVSHETGLWPIKVVHLCPVVVWMK